ncbi:GNAT family N-acetyltransferase [Nocardiopsis metallicus]|uniref:Uncharacterized protein n=1 Tax=Nocardiopsis metallicus TaxID=179819 RepID=A0A840WTI3_9ACTN|nr:GNAT family N-acetyltransferase [Nocardiopsis metallicus]MBB5494867.1 hypothetical protein [Nocardiopsis metallicus]
MNLYFVHVAGTGPESGRVHEFLALPCDEQERPGVGVVVEMGVFAARQILDQQIGAIRWHQDQGVVSGIYVAPRMRRQRVATALWRTACNLYTMSTGGRALRISGRRTVLGDLLARRVCDPPPPLGELVLPMTPRSEIDGAEQRQLAPDDVEEAVRHYRYLGVSAQMLRAYCAPTADQAWIQHSSARRGQS